MNKTVRASIVIPAALLAVALSTDLAARDGEVTAKMTQHKVVPLRDGVESFDLAERARPGDIIEYRVVYANEGKVAVNGLEATLPIPAGGVAYLAASARPASMVRASLDGRLFETVPLKRTVVLADGRREVREVPLTEYRYLRWSLGELAAGQSIKVSARVRVSDAPVLAAQTGPVMTNSASGARQ